MTSFEVNTDIALIDPDWEVFQEQHEKKFGLAISYIKNLVEGEDYQNGAVTIVAGDKGFYVQSKNFPAAFFGDTGEFKLEFVSEEQAQGLVFEAVAQYRAGDARSLTCVYSDSNPGDVFFGYKLNEDERYEFGWLRAGKPVHLRVMIESGEHNDLVGANSGVLIYQKLEDKHMIIHAPGRRQPFLLLDGFNESFASGYAFKANDSGFRRTDTK